MGAVPVGVNLGSTGTKKRKKLHYSLTAINQGI